MKKEINELVVGCLKYFNDHSYTQHRVDRYKSMWENGILIWMKEKNLTMYTAGIGEEFIHSFVKPGYVTAWERDVIRSVNVLTDFLTTGCIRRRTWIPVEHPLDGAIGREMQKLIAHLQSLRRNRMTIREYELYLNRFLAFLKHEQVYTVSQIGERQILKFVSTMENNRIGIVSCLRVLFRFWHEQHIVEERLHELLDNYKWVKHEKIPSYYTAREVLMIEKSVDRSSGVGKRNYAMLLLASRLGLRASDIAGLKFSNIDWEKNEINLTQCKTGSPISFPLLSDVGNAVIDWLKHGRFRSGSQHIFLSARAPYVPATNRMVCSAIRYVIEQSGVSVENRRHGPHAMRHSLTGRLLENGVSIHVISEVLGHAGTETTMSYLRIDVASLLKCSLPVPPVSDGFYLQKGGVFYE